jgi:serine/threonine protein kinase
MSDVRTSHPTSQQLSEYGLGKLSSETMSVMENHLASCADCRRILENQSPVSRSGKLRATTPRGATALPRPGSVPPARAKSASSTSLPPHKTTPRTEGEVPLELVGSSKFQILSKLGQGAMGSVYKAKHRFLGDVVAIKVMNADVVENPEARARFLREMQAAGQLKHPHIVRTLDAEQIGDLLFLVMEFVGGISLDRLVAQRGPLPVDFSCRCIMQAALGLQHAHDQRMVHRDIKPANLMVTAKEKEVKLLDFGLARGPRELMDKKNQTQMQTFMGTPEYVAPEQATDARSADIRADIYGLGCTLYYLLAGRPPFQADTPMETIVAQIQDETQPLPEIRPEVSPQLWAVVAKMMAKSPSQRYQTPIEVVRALQPFTGCKSMPAAAAVTSAALPSEPAVNQSPVVNMVNGPTPTSSSEKAKSRRGAVPASDISRAQSVPEAILAFEEEPQKTPGRAAARRPERRSISHSKSRGPLWAYLVGGGVGLLAVLILLGVLVFKAETKLDPKPPPRPERINGFLLDSTVDCGVRPLQVNQPTRDFDITKPWVLSFAFQTPDYKPELRFPFLWGDERAGRDPIFVHLNGTQLCVGIGNSHNNSTLVCITSLKAYPVQQWITLTFWYRGSSNEPVLFLNDKVVRWEGQYIYILDGKNISTEWRFITPSVDRPMPIWLGCQFPNSNVGRFRGKIKALWLSNVDLKG